MNKVANPEFDEIDSLMDEAHARRIEIDGEMAGLHEAHHNKRVVPHEATNKAKMLRHERNKIDSSIQELANSQHVPVGYLDHYNEKYRKTQPQGPEQPASEEGPGILSRIMKGAGDTAKFVVQHPLEAGKNVNLGVEQFASMPHRALESVLTGGGEFPILSTKRGMRKSEEAVAKSTQEAGVDPRSTGPVVAQAAGAMALPVGPTLKAGQHIKNILKSGAFGGGAYAGERVAADETVDDGGLTTSAGVGAGIGAGLSALLSRGKAKPGAVPPPAGESKPAPLQLEHKPPMVTPEPPRGLPAPEGPGAPSHFDKMMESIKAKTETGEALSPEEERFALWHHKNKGTPPPNVSGERTRVRPLERILDVRKGKGSMVGKEPTSAEIEATESEATAKLLRRDVTPTASPKAASPGVPKEAPPTPSALAKVLSPKSAEPAAVVPKASPLDTSERDARLAAKVKENTPVLKPKEGAVILPKDLLATVKAMDEAKDQASKEALLGDIVSGKKNVKDIPVGRKRPKPEAPAPAVKGVAGVKFEPNSKVPGAVAAPKDLTGEQLQRFYGAINKDKLSPKAAYKLAKESVGDVYELESGSMPASDILKQGEIAAKVKLPFVERRIEQARQKLAEGKIAPAKADVLAKKLIAEGKDPAKAIDLAEYQANAKVTPETKAAVVPPDKPVRLEDFIKEKGYTLHEREPFPGEKAYDVRDAKGNTIARGDRENIIHGLNARNEGKGIKLHSFPAGIEELGALLKSKLGKLPDDTTVSNTPHREKIINMALRNLGLQTPQFAMRHSKAGTKVVNSALDAEDLIHTRINDLMYDTKRLDAKGQYQPTDLFHYYTMDAVHREKINEVLVLGDKVGKVYSDAELAKAGLSIEQIQGYRGVREALDKVAKWVKELGGDTAEFDPKIVGYIPRVWKGNWEIFEGGVKHVPVKGDTEIGSSFSTLSEAATEAHRIKASRPDAKLDIRFFADPDYLPGRGILDARAVARVKKNLESMGKLDSKAIDEAFKMGRSIAGFAKHLLERKDAAGYETQDLDKVLFSYFNQAARKVEFKKVREVVTSVVSEHKKDLTGPQVEYLKNYVERVAGKPSWDKLAFEQFIKHTPIGKWVDPVGSSTTMKTLNDYITYKSLGFGNASWALINLDTLSRHVWPMLQHEARGMGNAFASEKYMFDAVKSFYTDKALRQKLAHNGVIDIQMMSESRPQIGHKLGEGKWTAQRVIMFLGLATEEFTRGVGAIARYKMALDQGFKEQEAMRLASRFVAETAARYSKAGKAPIFTGPTGETLGKFKPYLGVMMQNMYKAFETKDMGVITRYMLASIGVGGLLGQVPGAENVDHLATKHLGFSPIQWGYDHIPEGVLTGAASVLPGTVGLPNIDLSRKAGLPDIFPSDLSGWAGPVLNTYGQAIADTLNGEYNEALRDLMPTSIRNVIAVTKKPGYVVGRYDKPSVELPPGEMNRIVRGAGFQSPEEVRSSRDYSYLQTLDERRESALQRLTRRIYQNKASDSEREEFARMGGTNRRLREEGRRENSTSRQRQERHLPKILRHQIPEQ